MAAVVLELCFCHFLSSGSLSMTENPKMQFYWNCILLFVVTVLAYGFDKAAKLCCNFVFVTSSVEGFPYKGKPQNAILLELHFALSCDCVGRWL